MPVFFKRMPHLSAVHFHTISGSNSSSFDREYKIFKSESHCKNVEEVIASTQQLFHCGVSKNELFYIREGLIRLREKYEVTVKTDHPIKNFLRTIFPHLFEKHEQKVKLSLDHMIEEISHAMDQKGGEGVDFDNKLVGWIGKKENDILSGSDSAHKNVRSLLNDPEFVRDAEKFIRDISSGGDLPVLEQMKTFIDEIEKLKGKYGGKAIDHRELVYSAIFAGKKYVPHLANRLVKIRDDNYSVVFPVPGDVVMEVYNRYFEILANGIQFCSGDNFAGHVDLLHDKVADGVDKGFDLWIQGLKENQSEEGEVVKQLVMMKDPDFLGMVSEMDVLRKPDPEKSPEENLLELTEELDRIAEKVRDADPKFELTANGYSVIAEAFLVALGAISKKSTGGQLSMLHGFFSQLHGLLGKVDYDALISSIDYAKCNVWMTALLPTIKNMSGVDLEEIYLTPPDEVGPLEARFSHHVRENLGRTRVKVEGKDVNNAYRELDRPHAHRLIELYSAPWFRKKSKKFLEIVSGSSENPPEKEMKRMWMELNRLAVLTNKKLPQTEKIRAVELGTLLRAALMSDEEGQHAVSLILKMKKLIERDPALALEGPEASDSDRKKFTQFQTFREALDYCCRIDPGKLAATSIPKAGIPGGGIEMVNFGSGDREYRKNVSEALEVLNSKIEKGTFVSEKQPIYALLAKPQFVEDARRLYKDFLNYQKWGGSWTKSEQFGEQFHELIVNRHAEEAGLNPREISREEEERLLIATAIAARKYAPDVFSKLNAMELASSPTNLLRNDESLFIPANANHESTYNLQLIATVVGKGIPVSKLKEQFKRVAELIDHNVEEVLSTIKFKVENEEYQSADKEKCQMIAKMLEDEVFLEKAEEFVAEIATHKSQNGEIELKRMQMAFGSFIDNVNSESGLNFNKGKRDDVDSALQAALLTESGRKHLEPLVQKMVKIILGNPKSGDSAGAEPYLTFKVLCNALDVCCKVDPRALVNMGSQYRIKPVNTTLEAEKDFGRKIVSAVEQFRDENMSDLYEKALSNQKFVEDCCQFYRIWLDSLPYSGNVTKLEQFGEVFQKLIGDKYVDEFYKKEQKGADEAMDIIALSCIAAKELIPDMIRKFKSMEQEVLESPETANRYIAFMFYTLALGIEASA